MLSTNNPVADFEHFSARQEKELGKMPKCCECGEHIQDEQAYLINAELICKRCMKGFKIDVEDYM